MGFAAAELAEMARADAEIEATFRLTKKDLALGRQLDREAVLEGMDARARKRAEYQRQYREANREKVAERQRQYYEANREKVAEYQRQYYEANREKVAERRRRYYEAHKDEAAEYQRQYRRRKRMGAEGNVNDLQD